MAFRTPSDKSQREENKRRRVSNLDAVKQRQYLIDRRFVLEVQRLERDGRVENRITLEKKLGLSKGYIAKIRLGQTGVPYSVQLDLLHELYGGDFQYILKGVRDPELSTPMRWVAGRGKVDIRQHIPYIHKYGSTARWKAGPLAEEDPMHFPDDPLNLLHPHNLKKADEAGGVSAEDGEAEAAQEPGKINRLVLTVV